MFKTEAYFGGLMSFFIVWMMSCSTSTQIEPRTNISAAIKGRWTLRSIQDYLCQTGEISNEVLTVENIVREHYDFGEFEVYMNGELIEEQSGTFEVLENDYYRFITPSETYTVKIEVSDDPNVSTMWFDLDQECREVNGVLIYTYSTWSRTVY